MKQRIRKERKTYAMLRMIAAIGRAIASTAPADKDRAARWAAAWGVVGGIRSPGIRLRRDVLCDERRRQPRERG
jgi:hypothetical protein